MIGIYKITNPVNKVYIGQSRHIEKRFIDYNYLRCKSQVKLYNSFLKYGIDNHVFEVLCECLESELNDKERYYQDLYSSSTRYGLNCMLTKSTDRKGKLSEETKEKISKSKKGVKLKASHVLKVAESNRGKKRTKEHCEIIRLTHKGKTMSIESRLKLSNSLKGRTPYNKGLKLTKEAIEKRTYKQAHVYLNVETFIFYSFNELKILHNKKPTTLRRYINKSKTIIKV